MENFSDLKGQTILQLYYGSGYTNSRWSGNEGVFIETDQGLYCLTHGQECCEEVILDDCTGTTDLRGATIYLAEVRSNDITYDISPPFSYTFYELQTSHGDVQFRFNEEQDTFYSTQVQLYRVKELPEDCVPLYEKFHG